MRKVQELVVVNRLNDVRDSLGLSQLELAEKCGTTLHTIESIENGIYEPSLKLAFIISTICKKQVNEIFGLSIKTFDEPENVVDVMKNIFGGFVK